MHSFEFARNNSDFPFKLPPEMRYFRCISPLVYRNFKSISQNPRNGTSNNHLGRILTREYCTPSPQPSEKVSAIVEEISCLTLLELSDLTEVVRTKLGVKEMPAMFVQMPGIGFSVKGAAPRGGAGVGKVEEKAEKTVFDVKLEGYGADKVKVIKEVRVFTGLGLKESKELVEKAPTLLKKGVTKDEAEKIIAKMKEVGANVSME